MDLSVVVATYRRPALLRRCLASLRDQDLAADRFEVVVVDDGSKDATGDVVRAAGGNVRGLTQPRNTGPAAARNRGVEAARAGLVLFLDDDIAAAGNLLTAHLAAHESTADPALAVLGRVDWDPALAVTPFMRWLDRSGLQFGYATWLRAGRVDPAYAAFYTANLSVRRELLLSVGGFDERFPYAAYEDMELAFRLAQRGLRLDFRPQAQAWTTRPIDLPSFRRRMQRVGASAELLRRIAPAFPLDDHELLAHAATRRRRARLWLAAVTGDEGRRDRRYWAEAASAYRRGRERASASA